MNAVCFDDAVTGIAALADPLRRALYRFVADQDHPVSRDEAASATKVARSVAATHLDRLVECGLLDAEFRRLTGRRGPGAGRPSKLYRRSDTGVAVIIPERRYDLAAELLAAAITDGEGTMRTIRPVLDRVARQRGATLARAVLARARGAIAGHQATWTTAAAGHQAGAEPAPAAGHQAGAEPAPAGVDSSSGATCTVVEAVTEVLAEEGYAPRRRGAEVVLANCPFHQLAAQHTQLVCGMNYSVLQGLADALPEAAMTAQLRPEAGWCCVRFTVVPAEHDPKRDPISAS